jgi:hypothetical protein
MIFYTLYKNLQTLIKQIKTFVTLCITVRLWLSLLRSNKILQLKLDNS